TKPHPPALPRWAWRTKAVPRAHEPIRDPGESDHRRGVDRLPCGRSAVDALERRLVEGFRRSAAARSDRLRVSGDFESESTLIRRSTRSHPPAECGVQNATV